MKKKLTLIVVVLVCVISLVACITQSDENNMTPEQTLWHYANEQYTWTGDEDEAISQQNETVLNDIKCGTPVIFTMSVNFKIDISTGTLENINTNEKWQYFPNDETNRHLKAGTYKYIATVADQTFEPNGGFTAWPIGN